MRLLPPISTVRSAVPTLIALTDEQLAMQGRLPLTTPLIYCVHDDTALSKDTHNGKQADVQAQTMRYPKLKSSPLPKAQTEALANELNTLYQSVMDLLGSDDARYIERIYEVVVYSELVARGLLAVSGRLSTRQRQVSTWLLGTSLLSFSKILNNMELGHNVMHGQYDWMQHPLLNSQNFDWDNVCPAPLWQHSHNYLHHTFTNIVGRDHDVGYHLIRITDEQPWKPRDRYNPLITLILALGFEWAVAFHDIQISVDEYADSTDLTAIMQPKSRALFGKIARQVGKEYIALPAAAGLTLGRGSAMTTLSGNITANIARNIWTWAVIFCGHFTEQAHIYTQLDANESKGDWYVRQILGSSNIQGNKWFHILTGNLSHQIEHHIFPDMPANHYAEIAPQVQAICRKYHLAYNTGRFSAQFKQVMARIRHFSKPSDEEWRAYKQSKSNSNNKLASNSANGSVDNSQAVINDAQAKRSFKKFFPKIIRQAIFYA